MNTLIISRLDYQRLQQWIGRAKNDFNFSNNQTNDILRTVNEATLLDPTDMPADVVTMNSRVRLTYPESNRTLEVQLVYPEVADIEKKRISIFAPLAVAILGCRQGTLTKINTPGGMVSIKIEEVIYQPEAAGDMAL
ncbi:GreA/GreB family elongation factor [Persicitalea jodogahamensis]|uniref:RNA polymerase-binding protein Rnk n=1 Tax=Persicitalea jodogahamensis TaxID=402147 RepID=A0A8J3DFL0_9BACT|nr:GreA/GreB family elongation factor [Persicitalea jodogahamensis]GHB86873.1 RNA polymerase-binding protein Rnk [Persicitalea jodogahamensis]